jgi:hypothetical protein
MPNRNRWYAELAGTILLWVEEVQDNLPFTWEGHAIRRPQKVAGHTFEFYPDRFLDRSKESAIENLNVTVRQAPQFQEYRHRLGELRWKECDLSEEDWEKQVARFISEGRMEESV